VGFTRIESSDDEDVAGEELEKRRAPLSREAPVGRRPGTPGANASDRTQILPLAPEEFPKRRPARPAEGDPGPTLRRRRL